MPFPPSYNFLIPTIIKGQPRKNVVERMKNQRTITKDKENSQTWVGKTEQLHMDEVDQCKEDGCLMDCLF